LEILQKIRQILSDDGYCILLENVSDQAAHVFSRSICDWEQLFMVCGMRVICKYRYDYSPLIRFHGLIKNCLLRPFTQAPLNTSDPRRFYIAGRNTRIRGW